MEITSSMSLPVTIDPGKIVNGRRVDRKIIMLKPGKVEYKEINHKDPFVAEQLRVYRKHKRISFLELLPSDIEILKTLKGTPDEKEAALKKAISLKPSPVSKPKPIEVKDAERTPKNPKTTPKTGKK